MAHIRLGGWLLKRRLFAQVKLANQLWWHDGVRGERQTHLFFLGWYDAGGTGRLFTLILLGISVQIGVRYNVRDNRTPRDDG